MATMLYHPGLEGVIAGETNISRREGEFIYRGYAVADLVQAASFLEVAHLLLTEELPTQEQLADFRSLVWEESFLPELVQRFISELPMHVGPLEMLRTGASLLGNCDFQLGEPAASSGIGQAIRLLGRIPLLLSEWRCLRDCQPACETTADLSYAAHLLTQLTGREPSPTEERVFCASLIVAADDAFNPSTFAARLASASGADMFSAVTAAMAPLASLQAGQQLSSIRDALASIGKPDNAVRWVRYRVGESLPLPGFERCPDEETDPRPALLARFYGQLADESDEQGCAEVADAVELAVWEAAQMTPTLDWSLARLYQQLGIARDLHLPAFICGRLVGWCAHAIEQADSEEPIRPRSRYRGAEQRVFEPLHDRG